MATMAQTAPWTLLNPIDGEHILLASRQCKHAIQIIPQLAERCLDPQDYNNDLTLTWDDSQQALLSTRMQKRGTVFHLGLRLTDLTFLLAGEDAQQSSAGLFALDRRTSGQILEWLSLELTERSIDAKGLQDETFDNEEPAPGFNGRFVFDGNQDAFAELAKYFSNAAIVLGDYCALHSEFGPAICSPTNFGLTSTFTKPMRPHQAVEIGMCFGDNIRKQPFFFVTGRQTDRGDWNSAVLLAEKLTAMPADEQHSKVLAFLEEASNRLT